VQAVSVLQTLIRNLIGFSRGKSWLFGSNDYDPNFLACQVTGRDRLPGNKKGREWTRNVTFGVQIRGKYSLLA
jgi:hypothetical protein